MATILEALQELREVCRTNAVLLEDDQIEIGDFTYGTPIIYKWDKQTKLKIGKFCSIGGNVQILMGGEHHTEWNTTYPLNVFLAEQLHPDERLAKSKGDITIGNDVWIGNDVIILSGVKIGNGAVIGAGTVVTKDVQPYSVVGGNPSRMIKWRMPMPSIVKLWRLEWWNWPVQKIASAAPLLASPNLDKLIEFSEGWDDYE